MPHFWKISYYYREILKLQSQPHKIKWTEKKNIKNLLKVPS
jgi:ribosomal protein L24E